MRGTGVVPSPERRGAYCLGWYLVRKGATFCLASSARVSLGSPDAARSASAFVPSSSARVVEPIRVGENMLVGSMTYGRYLIVRNDGVVPREGVACAWCGRTGEDASFGCALRDK